VIDVAWATRQATSITGRPEALQASSLSSQQL
jgi:hypothetical protein